MELLYVHISTQNDRSQHFFIFSPFFLWKLRCSRASEISTMGVKNEILRLIVWNWCPTSISKQHMMIPFFFSFFFIFKNFSNFKRALLIWKIELEGWNFYHMFLRSFLSYCDLIACWFPKKKEQISSHPSVQQFNRKNQTKKLTYFDILYNDHYESNFLQWENRR